MIMFTSAVALFVLHNLAILRSEGITKIDCHPDPYPTKAKCTARGCLWITDREPSVPSCYFDSSEKAYAGYDVKKLWQKPRQISATLLRRKTPSIFGNDFQELIVEIKDLSESILQINIKDSRNSQFTVPHKNVQTFVQSNQNTYLDASKSLYDVHVFKKPFGIKVIRKIFGTAVFDTTSLPGFTFSRQFLQLTTKIPSKHIFGFGEHNHKDFKRNLHWKRWGMFNRDHPPSVDDYNLYGTHPFYMNIEKDGKANGVFLLNSHALDIALQPDPDLVTFRPIGGTFEVYIFLGPTPNNVIQQYSSLIGKPMMPPYWGLGFQLSRYGYKNTANIEKVLERNQKARIPQDIQVIDIDYMDHFRDFTLDNIHFANLTNLVTRLHNSNIKLVLIIDPGIGANGPKSYVPLADGIKMDIFIKVNKTSKKYFEGIGWPGPTYWPDFTHRQIFEYWLKQHEAFYRQINFDGLWYDMNEPSNMESASSIKRKCQKNILNRPPYVPLLDQDINMNSPCMDAYHNLGPHYQLHNLYGHLEAEVSNQVLKTLFPGKRPFLLTRSSFPGTGHVSAHWTGDNPSAWNQLETSIVAMLDFQMFGIPMIGTDICGFRGNTTEELCIRWSQLGAFYPFCRNHNIITSTVEQDPAAWSLPAMEAIRTALQTRYRLLPFLYTLFYDAHVSGSLVVNAMAFEWPADPIALEITDQFLWGSSFLIAPVMTPGATSRLVYFPKGRWYTYQSLEEIPQENQNREVDRAIPLNSTALFVRGGSVIPWQKEAQTTTESRKQPMGIFVALNEKRLAHGKLIWDDGESLNSFTSGRYLELVFSMIRPSQLTITQLWNGLQSYKNCPPLLGTIQIAGFKSKPKWFKINGTLVQQSKIHHLEFGKAVEIDTNVQMCQNKQPLHVTWGYKNLEKTPVSLQEQVYTLWTGMFTSFDERTISRSHE